MLLSTEGILMHKGQFFKQLDGCIMGSPLYSLIQLLVDSKMSVKQSKMTRLAVMNTLAFLYVNVLETTQSCGG